MKVLITGASGLIGQWICDLLDSKGIDFLGVDIRPPSKPEYNNRHRQIDILDLDKLCSAFKNYCPDGVIHLAARIDLDGKDINDYKVNIKGTQNICDAIQCIPTVKKAIYTSSQLVCKIGYVPQNDHDYCPNTKYGESKVLSEKIARENGAGKNGVNWCIVRPTTVWGPYMSPHYQSLLRHIQRGTYFHSGKSMLYKSYSYAGNIAYQYYKLLLAPAELIHRETFYLADYEPTFSSRLCKRFGL